MTSLFMLEAVVPDKLVAATPAPRKKCSKIRGTAGPRRARLIREIAKEMKKSTSKIGFVKAPVPPMPDPVPSGSTRDASPPPTAREDGLIVPSPDSELLTSSEDEDPPSRPSQHLSRPISRPPARRPLCCLSLCQSAHRDTVQ